MAQKKKRRSERKHFSNHHYLLYEYISYVNFENHPILLEIKEQVKTALGKN